MATWSTEDLRPHERFDAWLELRVARHGGGRAELDRAHRANFHASYSTSMVGDCVVSHLRTSAYRFSRSAADIARTPVDRFAIVQQLGDGCVIHPRDSDALGIPGGGFSTHFANAPYTLTPIREQDGFHANIVSFPLARCGSFVTHKAEFGFRPLAENPGASSLFGAYFRGFIAQTPHLKGTAAEAAVETLLQLALVARGLASTKAEPAREAVRAGQLEAVRQFIARNLARADLTPARAAQAVGISVRQLHLLFEPTGTTFARYILAQRLDRARHLLALQPDRSVIDIVLACGIESQSVFYRAFRQTFAMTPNDYRDAMRQEA
jgi:AraC-like DNA-binding protein